MQAYPVSVALLTLVAVVQAQFTFTTNVDQILVNTRHARFGGAMTIQGLVNGLPVTCITEDALHFDSNLPNVTIPGSIPKCGDYARLDP